MSRPLGVLLYISPQALSERQSVTNISTLLSFLRRKFLSQLSCCFGSISRYPPVVYPATGTLPDSRAFSLPVAATQSGILFQPRSGIPCGVSAAGAFSCRFLSLLKPFFRHPFQKRPSGPIHEGGDVLLWNGARSPQRRKPPWRCLCARRSGSMGLATTSPRTTRGAWRDKGRRFIPNSEG
jgi:hypothetical protein